MSRQKDNYSLLLEKLDRFIRKYYYNKIIRGSLFSIAAVTALFLLYNVLEHNFYFNQTGRKFLFFSFILVSGASISAWIIQPLLKYFKLGETLSHDHAAEIIGKHFPAVSDKLLNILQLKKQSSAADTSLIEASINQKSEKIKVFPFRSAIDLRKNRKHLRYALPPFLLLLVLLFAAPSMIKESTKRIIYNNTDFERDLPFNFVIDKDELEVVQYGDYVLDVHVEGDLSPDEVFIELDAFQYRLKKQSSDHFQYVFKNVQKDVDFELYSGFVRSGTNTLSVLEKPNITDFTVSLDYPAYTCLLYTSDAADD